MNATFPASNTITNHPPIGACCRLAASHTSRSVSLQTFPRSLSDLVVLDLAVLASLVIRSLALVKSPYASHATYSFPLEGSLVPSTITSGPSTLYRAQFRMRLLNFDLAGPLMRSRNCISLTYTHMYVTSTEGQPLQENPVTRVLCVPCMPYTYNKGNATTMNGVHIVWEPGVSKPLNVVVMPRGSPQTSRD